MPGSARLRCHRRERETEHFRQGLLPPSEIRGPFALMLIPVVLGHWLVTPWMCRRGGARRKTWSRG